MKLLSLLILILVANYICTSYLSCGVQHPFFPVECNIDSNSSGGCCYYEKKNTNSNTFSCMRIPTELTFFSPILKTGNGTETTTTSNNQNTQSYTNITLDCGTSYTEKSHYVCGYSPNNADSCAQYSNITTSCCYVHNKYNNNSICVWGKDRTSLGIDVLDLTVECNAEVIGIMNSVIFKYFYIVFLIIYFI
jgi:hypothetical protein